MESAALVPQFDFAPLEKLVLDAVSSPLSRAMYRRALHDFLAWWSGEQRRPAFSRAAVQAWRAHLEAAGLAPASINQKLAAVRKLAAEAFYAGLLPAEAAQAIREVRGAKLAGVRTGNWLSKKEAEAVLAAPDTATLKGKRDRAILAVLLGCGLRRQEAAALTFEHLAQRDGRWCVVDLKGKHGRVRTIPMPAWAKAATDAWATAAGLCSGRVFRGVNKGGRVTGESLTGQGVLRCVESYVPGGIAPHDLRRTFAKLAYQGGAKLDQIQLSLGHASIQTTERYLGTRQDLSDAPCDYLHLEAGPGASDFGPGEILAGEQQRHSSHGGDREGDTVAEIQPCRVTSSPKPEKRGGGGVQVHTVEGGHFGLQRAQERKQ